MRGDWHPAEQLSGAPGLALASLDGHLGSPRLGVWEGLQDVDPSGLLGCSNTISAVVHTGIQSSGLSRGRRIQRVQAGPKGCWEKTKQTLTFCVEPPQASLPTPAETKLHLVEEWRTRQELLYLVFLPFPSLASLLLAMAQDLA